MANAIIVLTANISTYVYLAKKVTILIVVSIKHDY